MSIDLATLKKELAALAPTEAPRGKTKASNEAKPRNAPKFNAWNDFVLATQKDMALAFGIVYDSFPSHAAFIKAASEKGCGRVAAMKEASRRREEATGEEAFVKKRAKAWAAYVEANPSIEEATTYRQRQLNRMRIQMIEDGDIPAPVAPAPAATPAPKPEAPKPEAPKPEAPKPEAPKAVQYPGLQLMTINDINYFINSVTDDAFYLCEEDGTVGERAGLYNKDKGEVEPTY